jgi:hypothetical protein
MKAMADPGKHLQMENVEQTAALPLGSRISLDPWSNRIELLRGQAPRPLSAAEKRPFEVTPFYPHLKRLDEQAKNPPAPKP